MKSFFTTEQIDNVRSAIVQTINSKLNLNNNWSNIFLTLKELHSSNIDEYKKVVGSLYRNYEVQKISNSTKIINFLKTFLNFENIFLPGGNVVHIMANELKIPNGYFGIGSHQDYPSVQGSLNGIVSWFPLMEVNSNSFPLLIIPNSHLKGLLPTKKDKKGQCIIENTIFSESDFKAIEMKPTDLILMSVFTVHKSSLSGDKNKLRIALSSRYCDGSETTFIQRCFPSAYQRTVHRDLIFDNFPHKSDIQSLFL